MADLISTVKILEMMDQDALFKIMLGGKVGFIYKSLILIYEFELIQYIQKIVKLALEDDPLPLGNRANTEKRNDKIIQRVKLSRQILISIIEAVEGIKVAEETFNRFTEYIYKIDNLSRRILLPKLYKFINFISSVDYDYDDSNDKDALDYCIKNLYWHKNY